MIGGEGRADTIAARGDWLPASFFMGGFECSTHRRRDGRRLDLIEATAHDRHARADYGLMRDQGIRTIRDGLRWHLIEAAPGRYDWSSFDPLLDAAQDLGMQPIWDLFHYGVPDWLDPWSADFAPRFADFAAAAAQQVRTRSGPGGLYCPVNEASFFAWAAGEVEHFHPFGRGRGAEMKRQLAAAAIQASRAIRAVDPTARLVHADPVIRVVAHAHQPEDRDAAAGHTEAQHESWDMIGGRRASELEGAPELLDIIGVNFYWDNQWFMDGHTIALGHPFFTPLADILETLHLRYRRPIIITETGAEARNGPAWLRYVTGEVMAAREAGVPILGLCLYPVAHYPGWDDGRHCETGLIRIDPQSMARSLDRPMAAALRAAIREEVERRPRLIDAVGLRAAGAS